MTIKRAPDLEAHRFRSWCIWILTSIILLLNFTTVLLNDTQRKIAGTKQCGGGVNREVTAFDVLEGFQWKRSFTVHDFLYTLKSFLKRMWCILLHGAQMSIAELGCEISPIDWRRRNFDHEVGHRLILGFGCPVLKLRVLDVQCYKKNSQRNASTHWRWT